YRTDPRNLITDDLQAVNTLIRFVLHSDGADQPALARSYIIDSGGKRLRLITVLWAARACGYSGNAHIDAAAIVEFIHTATLLHDDAVDESSLQPCGRETANALWGNLYSGFSGDFLYSCAFQMMVRIGSLVGHGDSGGYQ
ncbi:MAG: polyprenyl synthetase family protein, partial [Candidatus Competibacteraceae bacterium]|nr:polyprenyl synthetase family protein [Candidatus Competibacteraceae bacterium]